ncbi:Glycosyltransferase Family 31 protein [Glomus cerebriforme]|uniref:Hexosyltransferase n=1 Tax=Glomus cerebriforme TaxID=658196 RepID=A0A397TL73_9GLOM|nr:Glycosyltransferase Family 31 protein [Glomus cerebriforme]
MAHRPFILFSIIIICLLIIAFFYLEYNNNITTTQISPPVSSSRLNENSTTQLVSTTLIAAPEQTQKSTPRPKSNPKWIKHTYKGNKTYGPIPFQKKMECDSYHEGKGFTFKQLWNWSPVRIFIGIWTVADTFEIRNLLRTINLKQQLNLIDDKVDFRFIIGIPPQDEYTPKLKSQLNIENDTYGDLIMLDTIENMNKNKAYYYWKWVAGYSEKQYDYVIKTDDDAFIHFQNLALNLRPLPRKNLYYGFENPAHFVYGELEVLSIDHVHMIASSPFNQTEWDGHEDRYLGYWLMNHANSTRILISENCLIFNDPRIRKHFSWRPWASPDSIVIHRLKEIPAWESVINLYIPDLKIFIT